MQQVRQAWEKLQDVDLRSKIDLTRAEEFRAVTRMIAMESRGRLEVILK